MVARSTFFLYFKILLLAFKAIHGLAPAYISNLLVIKRKSSYNIRSNAGILLEPPSGKMLATLGERAFQAAAPRISGMSYRRNCALQDLWKLLRIQLRLYFLGDLSNSACQGMIII